MYIDPSILDAVPAGSKKISASSLLAKSLLAAAMMGFLPLANIKIPGGAGSVQHAAFVPAIMGSLYSREQYVSVSVAYYRSRRKNADA